ncbi:unnamed protein product [Schistocephalus solidus]|uniref:Uncharacterized protein n=1 Tax=Schistocephalus solidus TaxID=70667 RepID=A0A183TAS0_SCHSO|nr:unnamed protein product [Schistocephalus solidus]
MFVAEDHTNLLHRLWQFRWTLYPVPLRPSTTASYIEKDLATCSHVYRRCDRVRWPSETPYDGPFRNVSREPKNFRIQRGTREEAVHMDRLKAAVPGHSAGQALWSPTLCSFTFPTLFPSVPHTYSSS